LLRLRPFKDIGEQSLLEAFVTLSLGTWETPFSQEEMVAMPWKGVTASERRADFLRDHTLKSLAEMYNIFRKTACKRIDGNEELGRSGLEDPSRRPHGCPGKTQESIVSTERIHTDNGEPFASAVSISRPTNPA
jgi:hypothetical protein